MCFARCVVAICEKLCFGWCLTNQFNYDYMFVRLGSLSTSYSLVFKNNYLSRERMCVVVLLPSLFPRFSVVNFRLFLIQFFPCVRYQSAKSFGALFMIVHNYSIWNIFQAEFPQKQMQKVRHCSVSRAFQQWNNI